VKKILVFSHEFPPSLGGAGSVAKRNVVALVAAGVKTTVLSKKGSDDVPGATFIRINVYSRFWFISYFFFLIARRRWLREFDVIILNDPAAIYIAGLCMPVDILAKSLAFMHGTEIEDIFESQSLIKRFQFFRFFFSKGIIESKSTVFPSEWLRDKFINHPSVENIFNPSLVVYAGINRDVFYEVESDVRKNLLIPESALLILSVSRVINMKGYPEMYDVFKRLHQTGKPFHWLIVGDGEYLEELTDTILKDELTDYIHIIGSLPQSELRKYYSAADVFLLLSKFEEAYGLVYLEASSAGTPSIGLQKGGVNEAILEGKTGFVVDNIDACYNLLVSGVWQELNPDDMKSFVVDVCSEGLLKMKEFKDL
jgi:glycosyltransferase involved in cell wall biosynthesis